MKQRRSLHGAVWLLGALALALVLLLPAGCGNGQNGEDAGKTGTTARPEVNVDELFPDEEMREYARNVLGTRAADFTLEDLEGRKVSLSSFKGKPVVLEFAKTTCPYCREVQPVVEEAASRRPDVAFLQVFLPDTREEIAAYLAENGAGSPESVVLAGNGQSELRERFGNFPYVPVFLFIDGDGTIVYVQFGSFDLETMEQSLNTAFPAGK